MNTASEKAELGYAQFYARAPIACCELDREGRIRDLNAAMASMLSASRETLLGAHFAAVALVRDADAFALHLARVLTGEAHVTTELAVAAPDHAPATLRLASTTVHGRVGEVVGCYTVVTDVTTEKEAERRLRLLAEVGEVLASSLDSQTTLNALARVAVPALADVCVVDVLDDGALRRVAVVSDAERVSAGTLSHLADAEGRLSWHAPQDVVVHDGASLILDDDAGDREDIVRTMRAAGITSALIVALVARGEIFGALTFVFTRRGRRYTHADRVFAEMIARRTALAMDNARLHARTQAALNMRDTVLALVSHDLKNPLTNILLHTNACMKLLETMSGPDPRLLAQLEGIRRGAQTMKHVVYDLCDAASMDAGTLRTEPLTIDAAAIVRDAAESVSAQAHDAGVAVAVSVPGVTHCLADRVRILRVLQNLLGNAIALTPAGGAVRVSCEVRGDDVEFAVEDTGPGIERQHQPHVFDRFWRGEGSAGHGLGLSIAQRFVHAHGGRIWVESEPGRGATFRFTLKRVDSGSSPGNGA